MEIFILFIATFALSSMWLYSPGTAKLNVWWIENMGPLRPLAYCQLCSGFWIGLALHLIFVGTSFAIPCALAYAGAAWMLGAITNAALWIKTYYEEKWNRKDFR